MSLVRCNSRLLKGFIYWIPVRLKVDRSVRLLFCFAFRFPSCRDICWRESLKFVKVAFKGDWFSSEYVGNSDEDDQLRSCYFPYKLSGGVELRIEFSFSFLQNHAQLLHIFDEHRKGIGRCATSWSVAILSDAFCLFFSPKFCQVS